MKKCVIFGSLPQGRGGMEKIISTLLESNGIAKFTNFYFDFHEGKNSEKSYMETAHQLALPKRYLPRFLQEAIVVKKFRKYIQENTPQIIICLDEKACKLAYWSCSGLKIILISWLHGSPQKLKNKKNLSLMDCHVAISKGIAEYLRKTVTRDQIVYELPNCVDIDNPVIFNLSDSDKKSFLYVGRIEYDGNKNLKDLFVAFSRLPKSIRLDIVGSGSANDLDLCKNACKELEISDRVIFHGWQQNAWDYLIRRQIKNIYALCLTSSSEGFPLVLIEAIYQGIFCIASDCPTGPSDIINDDNGLLYTPHDVDSLEKCMLKAMDLKVNPYKVKASAMKYGKENYLNQWHSLINEIIQIYGKY